MIRELDKEELRQVNGGLLPLIGLATSIAGHFTARTVVSSFASRIGLGASIYGAAAWFNDK